MLKNAKFSIKILSKFQYQHLFLVLNQHYFRIISTQNVESKCKLKPKTY
jgi:ribosome biogenesis protein Tsr3